MVVIGGVLISVDESDIVDGTFEEWDGIVEIDEYAFRGLHSLTKIRIPYGITSIGAGAFSSCENLKEVYISDSVTKIKEGAFSNCYKLNDVVLSDRRRSHPRTRRERLRRQDLRHRSGRRP